MGHLEQLIEQGRVTDPASARGRLLDGAATLFREKGFERATVRDIGSAVGIQSGSIFHHFSSKEDILKAVMMEALVYFTARLRDAIDTAASPADKLRACVHSELEFTLAEDTLAVMSVLITEWRCLSPEHQADILRQRAEYEQLWLDVLAQGSDAGLLKGDMFILRRMLAGGIHWATTWYRPNGTLSIEELAEEILRMIGSGAS